MKFKYGDRIVVTNPDNFYRTHFGTVKEHNLVVVSKWYQPNKITENHYRVKLDGLWAEDFKESDLGRAP